MLKCGLRLANLQKIRSQELAFSLKIQKDFHSHKKNFRAEKFGTVIANYKVSLVEIKIS